MLTQRRRDNLAKRTSRAGQELQSEGSARLAKERLRVALHADRQAILRVHIEEAQVLLQRLLGSECGELPVL